MKNCFNIIVLFLYLIGTINGIGYSCYIKEYPTAIGVLVLFVMAWPTARKIWKSFTE